MRSRNRPLRVGLVAALIALVCAAPPTLATPAEVVRYGDRAQKVIALTFDDGWSPTRTARIVEILDRYGVAATFFPYASAVELDPALWRSIADRYPVGNHTLNHVRLKGRSSWQISGEIVGARRAFEAATGRRMAPVFRPPFGQYDETVRRVAYRAGYDRLVLWDIDSRDWKRPGDEEVLRRATAGTNGSIILLHCDLPTTLRVLPAIIEHYQRRGYRFVTVPQMLGIDWKVGAASDRDEPARPRMQISRAFFSRV